MAVFATGFLFRTHLVNENFGTTAVGQNLQFHQGLLHIGTAQAGPIGILHQQDGVNGHGAVDVRIKTVQVEVSVGLQPELLA